MCRYKYQFYSILNHHFLPNSHKYVYIVHLFISTIQQPKGHCFANYICWLLLCFNNYVITRDEWTDLPCN